MPCVNAATSSSKGRCGRSRSRSRSWSRRLRGERPPNTRCSPKTIMPRRVFRSTGLFFGFRRLEMAAEFVAHRRENLVLELRLAARTEARIERSAEDGGRDGFVDRRFDRPTALARIGDVARELR